MQAPCRLRSAPRDKLCHRRPSSIRTTDSRRSDVRSAAPDQKHQGAAVVQRHQGAAVALENAYCQPAAPPSLEPPAEDPQQTSSQQQRLPRSPPQLLQQQQPMLSSAVGSAEQLAALLQARARALFISRLLPLLRAVRVAERRLEARLPAVGNSIVLMAAVICYDLGINNVLDRLLGDSPAGSLSCVLVGLGMVLGVKFSGSKVLDFWEV